MAYSEVLLSQDAGNQYIELEHVRYDEKGDVSTWFVNIQMAGESFVSRTPWDTYSDAEWFFNEHR